MIKKFKLRFYINNSLFGSVKLIKNSEPDKHKYSCYSIGFDSCSEFHLHMEANLCILMIKIKIS